MAGTSVDVVVQIADRNVPAGRLWAHSGRGSESATFEYLPRSPCTRWQEGLSLSSNASTGTTRNGSAT